MRLRLIDRHGGPPSRDWVQWLGWAACAAVLALLVWRIGRNIDFADEYYYAAFIDDWLKGGVSTSTLRTLHQTAALVVYPAAWIYARLTGGETGLMLFLRALFVVLNVGAAASWALALRPITTPMTAWLVAAAALAFVPFGLPAPSYDTLAVQGLSLGLAGFIAAAGCSKAWRAWTALCALGWAIATVAYPSLLLALPPFLIAVWLCVSRKRGLFVAFVLVGQAVGWAAVLAVLGADRLHDSVIYSSQMEDTSGWSRKLHFALELLHDHPIFLWGSAGALACAALRRLAGPTAAAVGLVVLSLASLGAAPALYVRSHDFVLWLALYGVWHAPDLRVGTPESDRALAAAWLVSLCAAVLTTLSAYNSLYCFAIGGAPAAFVALAGRWGGSNSRYEALPPALAATFFAITTASFFYGDLPGDIAPRIRLTQGSYAGLALQPDAARALGLMHDCVGPAMAGAVSVAEIGRLPGLMMATSARPKMTSVFPLMPDVKPPGIAWTHAYYDAHPAQIVLIFRDAYLPDPINPFGPAFGRLYVLATSFAMPPGTLEVYQLRAYPRWSPPAAGCPPPAAHQPLI